MITKSPICFLILVSFFSPLAFGETNQILQLDKSPRMLTFGEATIAVPNSSDLPHLETPTSGLVDELIFGGNYGGISGDMKFEFDISDESDSTTRNEFKSAWTGQGLNLIFFTPLPTMISSGLLITGGIQRNKIDYKLFDSKVESKRSSVSAHGIVQVESTTLTLSLNNQSEKIESDSEITTTTTTTTDTTTTTETQSSAGEGSVSFNFFGFGLRQDFSPSFSIATTYTPKATKTYLNKNTNTLTNIDTKTTEVSVGRYEEFSFQNQTLSVAASLKLPDQNLTLAAGVSRLFPDKITIDSEERPLEGMTNLSLAAEMRMKPSGVGFNPRVGIHNKYNNESSLRSLQTGLALEFGTMVADVSLGYSWLVNKLDESDDSKLKVQFYSFALGLGVKI